MKRFLLLGALTAAVISPVAAASSATTHTLRGTVLAKDRAHHALVVALPGGKVQTLIAPAVFGRADIGRRVVVRYTARVGQLPVASRVSLKGHARHAVVRGTMVRLVKRHAIINAGGSVLNVTLRTPKRALASAKSGPKVGDSVKVEVDIDDDDSLDASAIVVTGAPVGPAVGSEGEMEVRGKVKEGLSAVMITVTTGTGVDVSCAIPAGVTLNVKVGDLIELKCDLIGSPGVWTVRAAHDEDDEDDEDDDSSEIEVRGTIDALTDTTVTVNTISCTIPSSVLAQLKQQFKLGDVVKMECAQMASGLTLKEIEKKDGDDDHEDESSDG